MQSSSLLPDALPRSHIPDHPWRPLGCQQQSLSSLSAGVSVSQGDGGGEEPLVSQDTVPGCCLLVLSPAGSGKVASGESRQPRPISVSLRLSFLTPRALSLFHEHLFLVA